ncbi:MAG TPA: zinc ribbon domain-containing protein [Candidatus Sericytochromatia bacterium]
MFFIYKAEALGKRVVHQDPRYTSQKCNICKHINMNWIKKFTECTTYRDMTVPIGVNLSSNADI